MNRIKRFIITQKRFRLIRRMYFFVNWIYGYPYVVVYNPQTYRLALKWHRSGLFETIEDIKNSGCSPEDAKAQIIF